MAAWRKPRKAWKELTPEYQKRMKANGLTSRNWATEKGARLRQAARGHAQTPERPERAVKNPSRYQKYLDASQSLQERVIAKKERMWGSVTKARTASIVGNVYKNPRTNRAPSRKLMREFLELDEDDLPPYWWADDDWGFLFYH